MSHLYNAITSLRILYLCMELLFLFGHTSSQLIPRFWPSPGGTAIPFPSNPITPWLSMGLQTGVAMLRLLLHLQRYVLPGLSLCPPVFSGTQMVPAPWISSPSFLCFCLNRTYLSLQINPLSNVFIFLLCACSFFLH